MTRPPKHIARKRFGQHFLHDTTIITRIIDAIAPQAGEQLVEIGPGLGALTLPLLQHVTHLDAIEIDRDAIAALRSLTDAATLTIHAADILKFDLSTLRQSANPLRLVGNLPYNISTPLLFHLIAQRQHCLDMHFMLQKEVVDRMAAQANDAAYGRLSVMLAPWFTVQPLFVIEPQAFKPPPRVHSAFVRLQPHTPSFVIADHPTFAKIVATAFMQRRKTLRNALRPLFNETDIAAAGIDPNLRAEAITPAGFAALTAHYVHSHRID